MKQHTLNPNKTFLNNHKWYSPISRGNNSADSTQPTCSSRSSY